MAGLWLHFGDNLAKANTKHRLFSDLVRRGAEACVYARACERGLARCRCLWKQVHAACHSFFNRLLLFEVQLRRFVSRLQALYPSHVAGVGG